MFNSRDITHALILAVIIVAVIFFIMNILVGKNITIDEDKLANIKIAACPSMFEFLKGKELDNISVIKTVNTATSLQLLSIGQVDYVLSGRPLKSDEGDYQQIFLNKNGYSFLSSFDESIYFNELQEVEIYTDQELGVLENGLALKNLIFIKNVYSRPEPSFAVTSWDNTDYSRANILHVLSADNSRYNLSRTPILYCNYCQQGVISLLQYNILKKPD